ncbi:MAG: hypothetical protein KIS67_22610 [Verrucomicrobiae bacterium]|nr:hypothetical protein [Verrucomicrobiae bacterium]
MQMLSNIRLTLGLGATLALLGIAGCSVPKAPDSLCFVVRELQGRARCFPEGSTNAQALKVGDKLHAGQLVQTSADGRNLDIALRRSILMRFAPDSAIRIIQASSGSGRVGDSAKVELLAGRTHVKVGRSAACEIGFPNGVVRICDGMMGLDDRGCVKVWQGSASVMLAGQSQPTVVPQGYVFYSASGEIHSLAELLNWSDSYQ